MESRPSVLIKKVILRNYRSIEGCNVSLDALTFFVGTNGSGKSNFIDALRILRDSLNSSLDYALRERGGINEVRRRSGGHPTHFAIRVDFILNSKDEGHYSFEIGAKSRGEFIVSQEECSVGGSKYIVQKGEVVFITGNVSPPASSDRLYLVTAAGLPQFRPVFDALSNMGFYNINPDQIRALQPPDIGEVLQRDGKNLASVVERLGKYKNGEVKRRIAEYLERVVPGLIDFSAKRVGHMETIEFKQATSDSKDAVKFPAINMSDGTLRALATLVALFQAQVHEKVRLVGIEEPETALHPAAAGILRDCIIEASRYVQVLVTSHSAELLDDQKIPADMIRAVEMDGGRTRIGPLDSTSRAALHDRLYTAGELLRANQLTPDVSLSDLQLDIFEGRDE